MNDFPYAKIILSRNTTPTQKMNLTLGCVFCDKSKTFKFKCEGWAVRYGSINHEDSFCPDHAKVEEFFKNQCPGCVCGFPDCGLNDAFAWVGRDKHKHLTEPERALLLGGWCPRRINGSFSFNSQTRVMKPEELSDPAPKDASLALLAAIDNYVKTYEPHP